MIKTVSAQIILDKLLVLVTNQYRLNGEIQEELLEKFYGVKFRKHNDLLSLAQEASYYADIIADFVMQKCEHVTIYQTVCLTELIMSYATVFLVR